LTLLDFIKITELLNVSFVNSCHSLNSGNPRTCKYLKCLSSTWSGIGSPLSWEWQKRLPFGLMTVHH